VRIFEIGESFKCATYAVGGQWWDVGTELARVFHADGHLDDSDFQPWATTWEPPPHAWQCFELGSLMKTPAQVPAVVRSITRAIERQLTGAPTLIIYDEAWKYVRPLPGIHKDTSAFVEEIDDQLRALRKLNGMVAYWTQSLADMAKSPLADIMAESCKTKIFLANPEALNPRAGELYDGYGVNPRQRQIVAGLTPKKQYYLKGVDGCGVFDLLLGPVGVAYCGSGSKEDLAAIEALHTKDALSFPWEWLRYKKLDAQAEALRIAYQEQYEHGVV
jgi:type IV secretion system protein VirB4